SYGDWSSDVCSSDLVAAHAPEKIHKVFIDPGTGLKDAEADGIAAKIGISAASVPQARTILKGLYKAFDETDSSLAEINPLILARSEERRVGKEGTQA